MTDQRTLMDPQEIRAQALCLRIDQLEAALREFANPQHWAVSRRFTTPQHVWIGTVEQHPSHLAREALEGLT